LSSPTPRQNRVAPDGSIHARPERGLMMGNRGGRLHRPGGTLGRARWRTAAWICCLTAFRGRRRPVDGPGYTALFFLDEVTALAAGHRPCFECRRPAAQAFAAAWARANGAPEPPRAGAMDRILHAERRAAPDWLEPEALPDGSIFVDDGAFLVRREGRTLVWNFTGYHPLTTAPPRGPRPVVTPRAIRRVLAAGCAPLWHPSADDRPGA